MYDLDVICNTYSIEFPIFFMKKGFFVRWSFYWVKESSMLGETKKKRISGKVPTCSGYNLWQLLYYTI